MFCYTIEWRDLSDVEHYVNVYISIIFYISKNISDTLYRVVVVFWTDSKLSGREREWFICGSPGHLLL